MGRRNRNRDSSPASDTPSDTPTDTAEQPGTQETPASDAEQPQDAETTEDAAGEPERPNRGPGRPPRLHKLALKVKPAARTHPTAGDVGTIETTVISLNAGSEPICVDTQTFSVEPPRDEARTVIASIHPRAHRLEIRVKSQPADPDQAVASAELFAVLDPLEITAAGQRVPFQRRNADRICAEPSHADILDRADADDRSLIHTAPPEDETPEQEDGPEDETPVFSIGNRVKTEHGIGRIVAILPGGFDEATMQRVADIQVEIPGTPGIRHYTAADLEHAP